MINRELMPEDKEAYNQLVTHPLQSWEWGEFREKTGVKVVRVGTFVEDKLTSAFQMTIHQVPIINRSIGYFPKGPLPATEMVTAVKEAASENDCVFVKFEPNVLKTEITVPLTSFGLQKATKQLFTPYTFYLDLTVSEEQLLQNMHPKTRYNIRVAQKHGVTIQEENTPEAFARYLELTHETTKRQGFYAHTDTYHQLMWQTLGPNSGSEQPIAHLFTARYQDKILTTWILFLYKNVLYYPYGASSSENREVMASNLMMWETMRWGKAQGATLFDLWGTPGPNPTPDDPYFGFHRFKLGYGPQLVEFVGSYDLVLDPTLYMLYTWAEKFRWLYLKAKAKL
jgi:lipid II:glycine glycyltransferase (peptidoglycan interpeptide bridge formation enzyme)